MTIEYLKRFRNLVKWLVPFLLAIFLLFGCGNPAQNQGGSDAGESRVQMSGATLETANEEAAAAAVSPFAAPESPAQSAGTDDSPDTSELEEDGSYTDKERVALYLYTFGRLPGNYITKKQAEAAGWVSREGNLWEVAPGKSIGGSRYGNYEKKLPEAKGRAWYECDINFDGGYRGPERIIYSDDGLIYYTEDHYQTFEQLY